MRVLFDSTYLLLYICVMEEYTLIENSKYYGISRDGILVRLPFERVHNINKTTYESKLKIIKPSANNSKGYLRKSILYMNGIIVHESIHRLVAKTYIPNPENKPQVNHINGNKLDNRVENLEWATNEENAYHAATTMTRKHNKGENLHSNRLSEETVTLIAQRIKTGETLRQIAKEFNVAPTTITELKAGRSWRHLNLFTPTPRKCEKYFKESRYVPTTTEM